MGRRRWIAVALALLLIPLLAPDGARAVDTGPGPAALQPVTACDRLTALTRRGVRIDAASAGRGYCTVRGVIGPATRFLLRLPTGGWTQRYLQTGCGGWCGTLKLAYPQTTGCLPLTGGSIASGTTDMGHTGGTDTSWAGNPRARADFAERAVHDTAVVAKQVITRYYGRPPAYSYFSGCSDGGREALMEAQRHPADFDGITAGAPAAAMAVQKAFHHAWGVLTNRDADGRPILYAARLPLIHRAVLAACDARDGHTDGVLDDPRRCDFDPDTLICAAGTPAADCLTRAEAGVVQRIHDGAVTAGGVRLEPAVAREWGSEPGWTLFVPAYRDQVTQSEQIALAYLRHLAPAGYRRLTDLPFTEAAFTSLTAAAADLSPLDADLSAFRARGGRLILWHGWSDQHIAPQATLAYAAAMRRTMGTAAVASFSRLYLFPGLAHCTGGTGATRFDILSPLIAWTERGVPPATIPAAGRTIRPVIDDHAEYPWLGDALYRRHAPPLS